MLTIKKSQMDEMEKIMTERFINKVVQLLIKDFNACSDGNAEDIEKLKLFVKRSFDASAKYNLTKNESMTAYIVLCFLNGENFLETKEFTVYKYYLENNFYDPNKYIFEIPDKTAK